MLDTILDFLVPVASSLAIGLVLAFVHMFRNKYSKSFVVTLAVLPAIVCVVIMAVNGNIGAGVAVAGAFSLVRFRSAPGTAKEIAALFLAMNGTYHLRGSIRRDNRTGDPYLSGNGLWQGEECKSS